jgi:hypothetical protein
MVISDPRKLRNRQPWPGPSMPGASIAKPIRPGIWQDGEEVAYTITGHHLQVMGMTGAGKTEGGARGEIAETVTRKDAAVIGFDITKGDQGLGPLEPCLHGLYRENEETLTMLARVHTLVRARTDFLAARGLGKWVEGCGLTHLTAWLEEAPDIIELLNNANAYETWESDVKAARSAGIRWVISLQRADFSQMPTLIRGQLAKMCFGVAEESDAAFGLSPVQRDRNATPELWQDSQPGMCYLDASCIPDPYKAMAMRTWFWGEDTSRVAEFAAQYPAANRPLDRVTASVLGLQAAGQAQAVGMPADGLTCVSFSRPIWMTMVWMTMSCQPASRPMAETTTRPASRPARKRTMTWTHGTACRRPAPTWTNSTPTGRSWRLAGCSARPAGTPRPRTRTGRGCHRRRPAPPSMKSCTR